MRREELICVSLCGEGSEQHRRSEMPKPTEHRVGALLDRPKYRTPRIPGRQLSIEHLGTSCVAELIKGMQQIRIGK